METTRADRGGGPIRATKDEPVDAIILTLRDLVGGPVGLGPAELGEHAFEIGVEVCREREEHGQAMSAMCRSDARARVRTCEPKGRRGGGKNKTAPHA